jgi:two-component system response regulator DesR
MSPRERVAPDRVDIAAQVNLAPGTVHNYISSAMSKLGAPSRHAAAHRAYPVSASPIT